MLRDMLTPNDVYLNVEVEGSTKEDALTAISELCAYGSCDAQTLKEAFVKRENEYSTGFGGGVAIPHAKIAGLTDPKVAIVRLAAPIDWDAIDDEPVDLAICLIMPAENGTHLQVISHLARALANTSFVQSLKDEQDPVALRELVIQKVEV